MLTIFIIMRGFTAAFFACLGSLCASPVANYLCDYPPVWAQVCAAEVGETGLQHVRAHYTVRLTVTAFPAEREKGRGPGKWIWRLEIGSGMLLVNFHILMLFEHSKTCAQKMHTFTHTHTHTLTHTHTHTHKHSWEPHPLPILLFPSALRLLSSLVLPSQAAKLNSEKLNNHKSFQLADRLHFFLFNLKEGGGNGRIQQHRVNTLRFKLCLLACSFSESGLASRQYHTSHLKRSFLI